jgi:hypothetical protein
MEVRLGAQQDASHILIRPPPGSNKSNNNSSKSSRNPTATTRQEPHENKGQSFELNESHTHPHGMMI